MDLRFTHLQWAPHPLLQPRLLEPFPPEPVLQLVPQSSVCNLRHQCVQGSCPIHQRPKLVSYGAPFHSRSHHNGPENQSHSCGCCQDASVSDAALSDGTIVLAWLSLLSALAVDWLSVCSCCCVFCSACPSAASSPPLPAATSTGVTELQPQRRAQASGNWSVRCVYM